MPTQRIAINLITTEGRETRDLGDIESLALSISRKTKGEPLQNIVVEALPNGNYRLLAGERRLEACKLLGYEDVEVKTFSDLTELERLQIEMAENVDRKAFTWQEEVTRLEKLHELRSAEFQASEAHLDKENWTIRDTAGEFGISASKLHEAISLSKGLREYPDLVKERTRDKAEKALKALRKQAKNVILTVDEKKQLVSNSFLCIDALEGLATVESGTVSMVLTDISSSIENSTWRPVLEELVRVVNVTGCLLLFFPMEDYRKIEEVLVSHKMNVTKPAILHYMGESNFTTFLWASKGLATPPKLLGEHYNFKRDEGYLHSLDKPTAFLFRLIDLCTNKGYFILDPFAYSGKVVQVAIQLGRNVKGFCKEQTLWEQGKQSIVEELLK